MRISIEEAAGRLDELVDRALAGELILLLDGDRPAARLEAVEADIALDGTKDPEA
ncbi:hypothetical protein [Zavarzinia sp. CC-PAN008]|uniref:hypothetical protein n=1 Tax=Zavarzinia sp. CC-PAN008 TaxID=3243332 RepID=UPI003F7463A3